MPDAIAGFTIRGREYFITANEGDGRDWPGFGDEVRVGSSSVVLDPTAFPDAAALKANAALGRLNISRTDGLGADGEYEALYAFGGRSATIWDSRGERVWDSGDSIERRVAADAPAAFNASNDNNALDDRSDNKGPEPEGVATGEIDGRTYAFVGLERIGGFVTFDVTDPRSPGAGRVGQQPRLRGEPSRPRLGPRGHPLHRAARQPHARPARDGGQRGERDDHLLPGLALSAGPRGAGSGAPRSIASTDGAMALRTGSRGRRTAPWGRRSRAR